MKNTCVFLSIILLGLVLGSCQSEINPAGKVVIDSYLEVNIEKTVPTGKEGLLLPESSDYSAIPQDPKNPLSKEKVRLGQLLYHETGLATESAYPEGVYTYSCASCHHAPAGFQSGKAQAIGDGGIGFGYHGEMRRRNPAYLEEEIDVQPIRTPSTLNIAYQKNVLWNGQFGATGMNVGTESLWEPETPKEVNHLGYEGTEIQAIAGLTVHRMKVDKDLVEGMDYKALFDAAFPQKPESDRYTEETAGLAIAAYERTLLANQAPFQRWLKGDYEAMSNQEKRGANLFFTKAKCYSCHNGPALSSMNFYALGMDDLEGGGVYGPPDESANKGRGGFTGQTEDEYKFKVPQLYNLKDSPFYGHGGSFHSVKDVITYKNEAQASNATVPAHQMAEEFIPLKLTNQEVADLTRFIEDGLHDPGLARYEPLALPSGFCFPNNDPQSRIDQGCQ